MNEAQDNDLSQRILELRSEHRALDKALIALSDNLRIDDLQMQRLKKRKLFIKDSIDHLEHQRTPTLLA